MLGRQVLGNYTLVKPLGEGGMGAVYVAQHRVLDQRLAVKVLHAQFASNEQIVARFVAEAKAATAIKHPNIVQVVDVGQFPSGQHYIALEFLEGYPLDQAPMPLACEDALRILVQVCAGLEAAHARGIVHRDLKPANIFITPQPGNPLFAKVLDFGIAKLGSETLAGDIRTQTHQVMGTPAYMSPEQARGSAGVTHLTDVYALGAIAFELMTGRRPYEATSLGDLTARQVSEPTPDPSRFRPDLPPGWRSTIMAALAIPMEARPQSVRDFAEMLIAATPGGVDLAQRVGFESRGAPAPPPSPAPAGATQPLRGGAVAAAQPTTLSASAGQSVAPAQRRRPVWVMAGIAAVVVGAAGAAGVASLSGGDAASRGETSVAAAAPRVIDAGLADATIATAPIDAAPATATLTIVARPDDAEVLIDGEPTGAGTVTVERMVGSQVQIEVTRKGFETARRELVVGAASKPVEVELERERRTRRSATRREQKKPPTAPPVRGRSDEEPGKQPRTKTYDLDDVGG